MIDFERGDKVLARPPGRRVTDGENLEQLLASINIATVVVDRSLRVRRLTSAAADLLNAGASAVGRALTDVAAGFPDKDLVHDTRQAVEMRSARQAEVAMPDGSRYLRRALPFRCQGDRADGAMIAFAEVTEFRKETQRVRSRDRQQRAVAALGQVALAACPFPQLLDRAAHAVARTLQVGFTSVLEYRPGQTGFRVRAGTGWGADFPDGARVSATADSDVGFALHTRASVVVEDFDEEIRFSRSKRLADHDIASSISVVIPGRRRPFGVLSAYDKTPGSFAEHDVRFLESVAHILAEAAQLRALTDSLEDRVARRTQLLTLLHELAAAANRAATVEEILAAVLRRIAEHEGWGYGHAYLASPADERSFVMAQRCYESEPGRFASFREATRSMLPHRDDKLLRRVLAGREPLWVSDVRRLLSSARARAGEELGFEYALAIPVLSGDDVVVVMEFFADDRFRPPEQRVEAQAVRNIAASVARVYERQSLERALASVAIEEHCRIGQELHDSISQGITGLEMLTRTLARKVDVEAERFERLLAGIRQTRRQVRALTRDLVPVEVEGGGLTDALTRLAEQTSGEHGVACTLECEKAISVPDPAATHLYHIAREAVYNAVKHGPPDNIRIALRRDGDALTLSVADGGGGAAQPRRGGAVRGGLGLQIMTYRARMIDGTLAVESDDSGVTVICTAPLPGLDDARA
jgi:two-component system sensor kinase FixL